MPMQDSARIRSVLYERIINFFKLYNAIIVYSALIILYNEHMTYEFKCSLTIIAPTLIRDLQGELERNDDNEEYQ